MGRGLQQTDDKTIELSSFCLYFRKMSNGLNFIELMRRLSIIDAGADARALFGESGKVFCLIIIEWQFICFNGALLTKRSRKKEGKNMCLNAAHCMLCGAE